MAMNSCVDVATVHVEQTKRSSLWNGSLLHDNAVAFTLDPAFIEKYVNVDPPWGPLGYVVYKRTYARSLETISDRHKQLALKYGVFKSEEWWLTVCRVVEGCYRIQQEHCQQLHIPWYADKAQRSAQEMYSLIFEMKFLPPGRGLWMMGTDYVFKAGGAALNNPLHEDTKIFTQEHGWVKLRDVVNSEITVLTSTKLYARDKSTTASATWAKAQISDYEEHSCLEITLRDYAGTEHKIVASQNHRWFVQRTTHHDWERITTEELREGFRMPIVVPRKPTPSFAGAQHGFFFGDGTRSNGELHQFMDVNGGKDSIQVLKDLFGREVVDIDTTHSVVRWCPKAWGELPQGDYLADRSYVYGWLAGYVAADGCVSKEGHITLMSSRLNDLVVVREMAKGIGIRTTVPVLNSESSNFAEERELWKMTIYKYDVDESFFLKEEAKKRWLDSCNDRKTTKRDHATVVSVKPVGKHKVLCATVPEFEQFVTEGFILTSNCAFVSTNEIRTSFSAPFTFLMDMSMLGVGVGGDTRGAGTLLIQEPVVDYHKEHVVSDDREGWVALARRCMEAFVGKDTWPNKVDYSKVRSAGALIKGFGGTAAGPQPLIELVDGIWSILHKRVGQSIMSSDIVDLFNMIGRCVVAGNVRRSAEIMFGEPTDIEFMELKNYEKFPYETSKWRWASNNAIWAKVGMDYSDAVARTALNGEPGYEWLENARNYGRMGRPPDYADIGAMGGNPCLEQTLESFELCCLVETFPSLHSSYEEYERTLKYAYLYAKTVTLVPTHDARTNAVMLRNRRIGCSQSGIVASMNRHGRRTHLNWCDQGYNYLDELDHMYSRWLCIPISIKKTSVKPSGTVSKLRGVPPGIHHPHSEYYFNVVRMASDSVLVAKFRNAGYRCEDLHPAEPNTTAVYFAVHEEHYVRGKNDVTIWEQLEIAAQMQTYWADNQVSVTVTFRRTKRLRDFPALLQSMIMERMNNPDLAKADPVDPEMVIVKGEEDDIKHALELYETRLKCVSFLPNKDHGFLHAPYQEINAETYHRYCAGLRKVDLRETENEVLDKYCDGEACSVPMNLAPINPT